LTQIVEKTVMTETQHLETAAVLYAFKKSVAMESLIQARTVTQPGIPENALKTAPCKPVATVIAIWQQEKIATQLEIRRIAMTIARYELAATIIRI
jgi:hypothetical protein